jgi:serine protease Do
VDLTPSVRAEPAGPQVPQPPNLDGRRVNELASAGGLNVISDVAEHAVRSVVNISTTRVVHRQMAPEEQMFRHFFGLGRNGGDRPQREHSLGSGVIVTADGIVLTNNHVIDKASEIKVKLSDGREMTAKLLGADPRSDIAVLRLDGKPTGLPTLPLADSDRVRLGEVVLAIGSPLGLAQSVSMGIVSAKGRADVHIADYEDFIQTDAAINPGNSGGALVNLRGELLGINTAIASTSGGNQGIGFAIPSNMVRPIMDSILRNGRVSRGWLGVSIQDLAGDLRKEFAPSLASGGVLITDVEPSSPAAKAGLQRGDVVVKLAEIPMDSPRRLRNVVGTRGPGAKVAIELLRDGKARQLEVTLSESPEPAKAALSGVLDGLQVQPLDDELRRKFSIPRGVQGGLVVVEVAPDTAAAEAGLQPGDVVLELNRKPVQGIAEFQKQLKSGQGGLLLLIFRDGRTAYLQVR